MKSGETPEFIREGDEEDKVEDVLYSLDQENGVEMN